MATVEWTDERLNDAFDRLIAEMAAMRADMKDMRAELKSEIGGLRTELKGEIAELRSDMHADHRAIWTALIGSYVSFVVAFVVTQL